jgi:peptidoglycan/xylan/chitin deacetylase (PgdA/CDA1 family)
VVIRPEQTHAIASAGHLLVNHTFHHRFADLWNLERLKLELAWCDQAIREAIGDARLPLDWFRPPWGVITAAVREIAKTRRIMPVTHAVIDPWVRSDPAKRPARWMIEDAKRRQGGIYVLHDGLMTSGILPSVKGFARRNLIPKVVKEVLSELIGAGFQFPDPSSTFQSKK